MFPTLRGDVICAFGQLVQDVLVEGPDALTALADDSDFEVARVDERFGGTAPFVLYTVASLGSRARFIGHSGADVVAQSFVEQLRCSGVEMLGVSRGNGARAVGVRRPHGKNIWFYDRGGAEVITESDIDEQWLDDCAVLHLLVHNLYNSGTRGAFWKLVHLAHEHEVPITFDLAARSYLSEYGVDRLRGDLRQIRPAVLMCGQAESSVMSVHAHYPENVGMIVNHNGRYPTRLFTPDGNFWMTDPPEVDPEAIVDDVGAGAVFSGAFLAGWVGGRPVEKCIELANKVASESIQHAGVTPVFDLDRSEQFGLVDQTSG